VLNTLCVFWVKNTEAYKTHGARYIKLKVQYSSSQELGLYRYVSGVYQYVYSD